MRLNSLQGTVDGERGVLRYGELCSWIARTHHGANRAADDRRATPAGNHAWRIDHEDMEAGIQRRQLSAAADAFVLASLIQAQYESLRVHVVA